MGCPPFQPTPLQMSRNRAPWSRWHVLLCISMGETLHSCKFMPAAPSQRRNLSTYSLREASWCASPRHNSMCDGRWMSSSDRAHRCSPLSGKSKSFLCTCVVLVEDNNSSKRNGLCDLHRVYSYPWWSCTAWHGKPKCAMHDTRGGVWIKRHILNKTQTDKDGFPLYRS